MKKVYDVSVKSETANLVLEYGPGKSSRTPGRG